MKLETKKIQKLTELKKFKELSFSEKNGAKMKQLCFLFSVKFLVVLACAISTNQNVLAQPQPSTNIHSIVYSPTAVLWIDHASDGLPSNPTGATKGTAEALAKVEFMNFGIIDTIYNQIKYIPNPTAQGVDSIKYTIGGTNYTAYIFIYRKVSREYWACPGAAMPLELLSATGIQYNWYATETATTPLTNGTNTNTYNHTKLNNNKNDTLWVQAIWTGGVHPPFDRVPIVIHLGTLCGERSYDVAASINECFGRPVNSAMVLIPNTAATTSNPWTTYEVASSGGITGNINCNNQSCAYGIATYPAGGSMTNWWTGNCSAPCVTVLNPNAVPTGSNVLRAKYENISNSFCNGPVFRYTPPQPSGGGLPSHCGLADDLAKYAFSFALLANSGVSDLEFIIRSGTMSQTTGTEIYQRVRFGPTPSGCYWHFYGFVFMAPPYPFTIELYNRSTAPSALFSIASAQLRECPATPELVLEYENMKLDIEKYEYCDKSGTPLECLNRVIRIEAEYEDKGMLGGPDKQMISLWYFKPKDTPTWQPYGPIAVYPKGQTSIYPYFEMNPSHDTSEGQYKVIIAAYMGTAIPAGYYPAGSTVYNGIMTSSNNYFVETNPCNVISNIWTHAKKGACVEAVDDFCAMKANEIIIICNVGANDTIINNTPCMTGSSPEGATYRIISVEPPEAIAGSGMVGIGKDGTSWIWGVDEKDFDDPTRDPNMALKIYPWELTGKNPATVGIYFRPDDDYCGNVTIKYEVDCAGTEFPGDLRDTATLTVSMLLKVVYAKDIIGIAEAGSDLQTANVKDSLTIEPRPPLTPEDEEVKVRLGLESEVASDYTIYETPNGGTAVIDEATNVITYTPGVNIITGLNNHGLDIFEYYVKCVENADAARAKVYIYVYKPMSDLYYACDGDDITIRLETEPNKNVSFEWSVDDIVDDSYKNTWFTTKKDATDGQKIDVRAVYEREDGSEIRFHIYTFHLYLGICREENVVDCYDDGRVILDTSNISSASATACTTFVSPNVIDDYCPGAELAILAKIDNKAPAEAGLRFVVYDGTNDKIILATYTTGPLEMSEKYYGFQFPTIQFPPTTTSIKFSIYYADSDNYAGKDYEILELFVKECLPPIIVNDGVTPVIACLDSLLEIEAVIRAGSLANQVEWLRCVDDACNTTTVMPAGAFTNDFDGTNFRTTWTSSAVMSEINRPDYERKYKVRIKIDGDCLVESDVFEVRVETCGYSLAVQSGRWSDPETWFNKRTPYDYEDAIIRAGVIVYTGSSSKSFGGRAFGRGANAAISANPDDWKYGENEDELNRTGNIAKLANIVTIRSGAALILGHYENAGANAQLGVNNPNVILSFGKIINNASGEAINASSTGIFDWTNPTDWIGFEGLHIMANAPLTTVARIGSEDTSIANNGYIFVNGNITAEQRIYNANSASGKIAVAGGELTVQKDFINGNNDAGFTGTLNVSGGEVEVSEWFRNGFLAGSVGTVTISGGVVNVAISPSALDAKFLNGSAGDDGDAGYTAGAVGTANLTVTSAGVLNINRSLYNGIVTGTSTAPANISVAGGKVTVKESVKSFAVPASNEFNISGGKFVMTGTPNPASDASLLVAVKEIVVSNLGQFIVDKNRTVNMKGASTDGGLILASNTTNTSNYSTLEAGAVDVDNVQGSFAVLEGGVFDIYGHSTNFPIGIVNQNTARNNVYFHRGVSGNPSLVSFRSVNIMPTIPTHPYGKLRILNPSASLTITLLNPTDEICIGGWSDSALYHITQVATYKNKIVFVDAKSNVTFCNGGTVTNPTFTHIRPDVDGNGRVSGDWSGIVNGTVERRTTIFGNATIPDTNYRFTNRYTYINFSEADASLPRFALSTEWRENATDILNPQLLVKDGNVDSIRAQRRYTVDFDIAVGSEPKIKTISLNYRSNAEVVAKLFEKKDKLMFGAGFDFDKQPTLLAKVAVAPATFPTNRTNHQYATATAENADILLGTEQGAKTLVSGNELIMFFGGRFISNRNGRWSDPETWVYGVVPNKDDSVEIRHIVYTGMWVGSGPDVLFDARGWGEAEDKLPGVMAGVEALLAKKVKIIEVEDFDPGDDIPDKPLVAAALIIGAWNEGVADADLVDEYDATIRPEDYGQRMDFTVPLVFGDIIESADDNSGIEIKTGVKAVNVHPVDEIMTIAKSKNPDELKKLKGLYILCNGAESIIPTIRAIYVNNSGLILNMGIIEVGK